MNTLRRRVRTLMTIARPTHDCLEVRSDSLTARDQVPPTLFLGGGEIGCQDASDANDDGTVDISDTVAILGVLFLGQGIIPLPGMNECGVDPTQDELGCETPPMNCQ